MDRDANQVIGGAGGPVSRALPAGKKLTRREVMKYGLFGLAGAAGAGAAGYYLLRAGNPAAADVATVFKNDAPKGQLWELWKKRGWAVEARNYLPLGRNVQCKTCPNDCLLEPEDRGRCRNKVNKDGKCYTLAYGNAASFHLDPIEKKPLYHFLPATKVFSFAASGCGFRCLNCQNWDLSQRKPEELKDPRGEELRLTPARMEKLTSSDVDRLSMFPQDVIALAEHMKSESVAYTYSEPTSFYEYMYDTAKLARERKIKNVWVTCGYINPKPLEDLCQFLDAANVDLKSFSEDTYRKLNTGKLQPILETIKTVKRCGVWLEVGYLVVPTYTDDPEMFRRLCGWLVENIGVDYPLHFLRFHPAHKLAHLPPTPVEVLLEARSIAKGAGLRYVYLGNVRDVKDADTTFCPNCGKTVIAREGFAVLSMDLRGGKCASCGAAINGVWST